MTIRHSREEHTQLIADYLPPGRAFGSKNETGSNLRAFLRGLAGEVIRVEEQIDLFREEILPDQTVLFLTEWESAVEIPDGCLEGTGSQTQRRLELTTKLADMNLQTPQDFIDLAAIFETPITVESGIDRPDLIVSESWTNKEARFTIVITFEIEVPEVFPYTFPIVFGGEEGIIIECLFSKLKPANCQLYFEGI